MYAIYYVIFLKQPDMPMDDEGICGHISKLEENQHGQVLLILL